MSSLRTSLLIREVIPFALMFAGLVATALAADAGLHLAGAVWIGRYLGIPGVLLILVHAGIHFNALLAWLAVAAMLINVASGLTGKYLMGPSRKRLAANRAQLLEARLPDGVLDERLYFDSLTYDLVKSWRVVHLPITPATLP